MATTRKYFRNWLIVSGILNVCLVIGFVWSMWFRPLSCPEYVSFQKGDLEKDFIITSSSDSHQNLNHCFGPYLDLDGECSTCGTVVVSNDWDVSKRIKNTSYSYLKRIY